MDTVTISPRFQVVIPKEMDRIELAPVRPAPQLKGFLRGIGTTVPREPDRT